MTVPAMLDAFDTAARISALMKPVVANMTDADIVDLIAYVSSRQP